MNKPKRRSSAAADRRKPKSKCRKCGSTDSQLLKESVNVYRGQVHGRHVTHVIRRTVKCSNCGQTKIDMHHVNRNATA